MEEWKFYMPTRIRFGWGRFQEIRQIVDELLQRIVLLRRVPEALAVPAGVEAGARIALRGQLPCSARPRQARLAKSVCEQQVGLRRASRKAFQRDRAGIAVDGRFGCGRKLGYHTY